MDYEEYNRYCEILNTWRLDISREDNISIKLETLEKFGATGGSITIHFLFKFLRDDHEEIRQRTAELVAKLFDRLKSRNQLYESLKYLSISGADVQFYSRAFSADASISLLGMASVNRDGYVRQKAIEMLAATKDPRAIRYLILRLSDWVVNVRRAATSSIQQFFKDEYRLGFIQEMETIEGLKEVGRVDLSSQYHTILDFILEEPLTQEWYKTFAVPEKARLLYVKKYIEQKDTSRTLLSILMSDTNFLIRLQALRQLDRFSSEVILNFLNDPSSQVRMQALYHLKDKVSYYYDAILILTSDLSASVRDLARYFLRSYSLDFRAIYKSRIERDDRKAGSILGLAEVGTANDVKLLKTLLKVNANDPKIEFACLVALQKIDIQQARDLALSLFGNRKGKVRKRCAEILRRAWDREIMLETQTIYAHADLELKKATLTLYSSIGGWEALSILIRAVSELDPEINDLAWHYLQQWRDKALNLFTRPPEEMIIRARDSYDNSKIDIVSTAPHRQKLWEDIQRYLRWE